MFITKYIKDVYNGVKSLLVGMKRTLYYFTHHKEIITQQYPDNRDTLVLPERFKEKGNRQTGVPPGAMYHVQSLY